MKKRPTFRSALRAPLFFSSLWIMAHLASALHATGQEEMYPGNKCFPAYSTPLDLVYGDLELACYHDEEGDWGEEGECIKINPETTKVTCSAFQWDSVEPGGCKEGVYPGGVEKCEQSTQVPPVLILTEFTTYQYAFQCEENEMTLECSCVYLGPTGGSATFDSLDCNSL